MYYHEGERRGRRPQCDGPRDADKGGVPGLLGDRREMIAEPRDSVRMAYMYIGRFKAAFSKCEEATKVDLT